MLINCQCAACGLNQTSEIIISLLEYPLLDVLFLSAQLAIIYLRSTVASFLITLAVSCLLYTMHTSAKNDKYSAYPYPR